MILASLPPGVTVGKRYRDYATVVCNHDGSHQERLPSGEMWCSFCKATEAMTEEFSLHVFVLADLHPRFAETQASLF